MDIMNQYKVGSYTGSGVAQPFTTGFQPAIVVLVNQTDGDVAAQPIVAGFKPLVVATANGSDDDTVAIHVQGMTDDTALTYTQGGAVALSSPGITLSATGFTVGIDNSVNENGKAFIWAAM